MHSHIFAFILAWVVFSWILYEETQTQTQTQKKRTKKTGEAMPKFTTQQKHQQLKDQVKNTIQYPEPSKKT